MLCLQATSVYWFGNDKKETSVFSIRHVMTIILSSVFPVTSSSDKHQSIDVFQLQKQCLAYDITGLFIKQDILKRPGNI